MSNAFSNPATAAGAPFPHDSFGLRQRPKTAERTDENANPNNKVYGTWDGKLIKNKVRAPPTKFLGTAGNAAFAKTTDSPNEDSQTQALAIIPTENYDSEPSLWVLAFGFRTEAHFHAILDRLKSCGNITSSRGSPRSSANTWIALRYSNALAAQKALCQHGELLSVGGSIIPIGVRRLTSDDMAKLGIDIHGADTSRELGIHSPLLLGIDEQLAIDESEVFLDTLPDMDLCHGERSGLDSVCEKVLAWFFKW